MPPQLSSLRNGPGAATLPPTVTRLHLEFAHKQDKGHAGSRKFWRDHLPSLKYHNPSVPMIVNRTRDQEVTPTLTIYMKGTSSSSSSSSDQQQPSKPLKLDAPSKAAIKPPKAAVALVGDPWQHIGSATDGSAPAPPAAGGETAVTINLRNVLSGDIWKQFVAKTGATVVEPTPADAQEMERIAELEVQSQYDRRVNQAYRNRLKEEKMRLEKARQEADALKAD